MDCVTHYYQERCPAIRTILARTMPLPYTLWSTLLTGTDLLQAAVAAFAIYTQLRWHVHGADLPTAHSVREGVWLATEHQGTLAALRATTEKSRLASNRAVKKKKSNLRKTKLRKQLQGQRRLTPGLNLLPPS